MDLVLEVLQDSRDGCSNLEVENFLWNVLQKKDTAGNLHRDTASHYRTKIEITTMDELTREDIQNIQSVMNSSVVNKQERKCKITYWNDDYGAYKDATVYIPDTQFKIKRVDRKKKIIYYSSIRIALIEY